MKKICFAIILFSSNASLKSQSCFNLDSIVNYLEIFSGIERQIATHHFYEDLIGCEIPQFTSESIEGETINSDSLIGKVIVMNFWFIDCAPCIAEIPMLNELVEHYENSNNIEFLGMSIDDSAYIEKSFLGKFKFDFKIIPNTDYIAHNMCVLGYPKTYIIDKKGKIRKVFTVGLSFYESNEGLNEMKKIINECLNE